MIGRDKDNVYFTEKTLDSWKLIIKRYKPKTSKKANHPVILCHGLAANKYSCDFGEENNKDWDQYSLAAYLSKGGKDKELSFDVWVPELRGRNGSQTFHPKVHPEKYNWSLDEYVDLDVPAIINHVQDIWHKETGDKPRVYWIGKSMGGMLAYAYGIFGNGNRDFKGVVSIGSPVRFKNSMDSIKLLVRICPRRLTGPVYLFERLNWNKLLFESLKNIMADRNHIEKRILGEYLNKGLNNTLSLKVINHFSIFIRNNNFCRYPRYPWLYDMSRRLPFLRNFSPESYSDNLNKFKSPLLVIAGKGDKVAHHLDVKYAFDHVGTKEEDKKYILFSKNNSSHDYCHLDLNLGKKAKEEVYPRIYSWIRKMELGGL
jgi:pimeloyl-ACP methyl ester carboxylesterase